jgi:REP element-mobilizing transposase RayT
VHVVLRAAGAVGNLRRRAIYEAIREATRITAKRSDFRIVHLSIQRTHVHLIVEADHEVALAKGMQGFQVSAAKHVNRAVSTDSQRMRRRGAVFPDRYHAETITSPRQARHTLAYVMGNWRKHQEDRSEKTRDWKIDWFSSAPVFPDWTEYGDDAILWRWPPGYEPLAVRRPQTWLLRVGWKQHAPAISYREVPSAHRE